ncbi:hypothetical protein ACERII_12685 [Evansella sp. AB-rgal1]|uniref:hypothetical protein n=1 Tax=Evansella sp. AB-rgal1 TaxID=3242696 RepID=UPI00359E7D9B
MSPQEKLWAREGLIQGHKPQDIADLYGYRVNTVKAWKHRATQKLRKIYQQKPDEFI